MNNFCRITLTLCFMTMTIAAKAADPFSSAITIDANTPQTRGFVSLGDLIAEFTDINLATVAPTYTMNSAVTAAVNLRGFNGVTLSYAANSTTLNLSIPELGINQNFTGATRNDSQDALKQWFRGDGRQALTSLLNKLAQASPIDPIAGNPNSLMSQMAVADFNNAFNGVSVSGGGATGVVDRAGHGFVGVAARFGSYTMRDYESTYVSLPLTYSYLFSNSRYSLNLDLPLTYIKNNGAKTASAMLGVGLGIPVAEHWSLTPALRVGVAGSSDLGSAGIVYSGGVTSLYRFDPINGFGIGVANMLAYYKTTSVKVGDYDVGYSLSNTVFRNGLSFQHDAGFTLFETPLVWDAQAALTNFAGSALYSRYYTDIAFSLGTRKRAGDLVWNALRLGLTYTFGDNNVKGSTFNLGYTF
jgi:hypothetical protein